MIGDRIRARRIELNLTQQELANKTSLKTKGAISRIENNLRDIDQSQVKEFSKALKVTPSWLMGWNEKDNITNMKAIKKVKTIPILGEIACGDPIWAEENYDGYFSLDSSMKADFILVAKGDSMVDAGISNGDKCFIRKTETLDSGKIAVVLVDDSATLKRIYQTDSGWILQPENKNYAPKIIDGDIKILGELVGIYKSF